jgi:hypothetical protein
MTPAKIIDQNTAESRTFAREIATTLTSGKNENVLILMIGRQGRGKSYSAMTLACHVALEMSDILGRPPSDFFNIDHMSIMLPSQILSVLKLIKKYGIYIFDDFGVGYGARDFNKKENKALNNMIQTMRVLNNLVIFTVPSASHIDKVGREAVYYKIVMQPPLKEIPGYDYGLTIGKIYKIEPKHIEGAGVKHVFPRTAGKKWTHIVFGYPPVPLAQEYDRRRSELTSGELMDGIIETLEGTVSEMEYVPAEPKRNKKDTAMEIIRDIDAGVYENIPQAIAEYKKNGISPIPASSHVRTIRSEYRAMHAKN